MHLQEEQMDYLFRFIERKFVYWYDLQIEIADHFATRIEEEMNENQNLPFEATVEKIYSEFGIFGFAKLVQEKQLQLVRAGKKLWWQAVYSFLTWPKLGLLLLCGFVSWQLTNLFDPALLMPAFMAAYFISKLVLINKFQQFKKNVQRLMLIEAGVGAGVTSLLFDFLLFTNDNYKSRLAFCLYFTVGTIITFASFYVFFSIKKQVYQLYPGAIKYVEK